MASEALPFRVWLRPSPPDTPGFALRFEVFDGRGILRVPRPGVLIDPPARVSGYEGDLSAPQVRSARFLHVSNFGRRRQTWFLSSLTVDALRRVEPQSWVELRARSDRGALLLGLEGGSPGPVLAAVARDAALDIATLPSEALVPLASEEETGPLRPADPLVDADTLIDASAAPPLGMVYTPSAAQPPAEPAQPAFAPMPGLVRHLRRQLQAERIQRQAAEAQLAELVRRIRR